MSAVTAIHCWTKHPPVPELSEDALILAPLGRDAEIAARMLAEAAISSRLCPDLAALCRELNTGAGFALLAEEALARADLRELVHWL